MVIATFGPSTGWAGKTIDYDDGVFALEGHGAITATDVLTYDRQGQIEWAYEGLKEWVQQVAATSPLSTPPLRTSEVAAQSVHAGPPSESATSASPLTGNEVTTKPKRPLYRRWWVIVVGVLVLLFVIGAIGSAVSPPEKSQPVAVQPEAKTPTPTVTQTPTPTPTPTPQTTPLKQQLKMAVANARDHMSKFEWDGKQVTVTYDTSDETFWNENGIIGGAATDAVDVMAAAFAFHKVKRVNINYLGTMTDQYGNDTREKVVELQWARALWNNVKDPESFKDRLYGDKTLMYRLASYYYVHPGIWKASDLKKEGVPVEGSSEW